MRPPRTPPAVLAALLRTDPGRPRITYYDDTPGATQGERIELSARVLSNWVSKAANLLQEEWDVEPGALVRLALPPHWRSLYWAMATWSVGACVSLDDGPAQALVTDDARLAAAGDPPTGLVTLAGLARSAPAPVPPRVLDEARELSTYPDQFTPWAEPSPRDPALRAGGALTAYDSVVPRAAWPEGTRLHTATESLQEFLLDSLAALALDGSVVLSRGPAGPDRQGRLDAEGVTLAL